jgi:hypothetical protein
MIVHPCAKDYTFLLIFLSLQISNGSGGSLCMESWAAWISWNQNKGRERRLALCDVYAEDVLLLLTGFELDAVLTLFFPLHFVLAFCGSS